ncbi:MAG: hypothetical protein COU66_03520 [Candidatus Pacebacteria bacterium CG10_big_fil_rev_8_21_14_0_10_44_11]|nr:MAG: hypothetical protein COU66_03520 [Candidatus Pacebacteria bacterium CG10_big_fil_rev_8_21_14_0_10_44_11]
MFLLIRKIYLYSAIFLAACAIFLTHYLVSGQAVYGDGIGYYAHLRSWVIDGDWNYTNEYTHIYNPENNNALQPLSVEKVQIVATTATGKAENHYSPAVGVLLLPFFLVAHQLSLLGASFGFALPTQGYSDLYQIISGIGAIAYVIFGLFLLEKIVGRYSKDTLLSRLTVAAVFFATNLIYYGAFDVINSHFASFFLSCLFFYNFLNSKQKNYWLLGLISGALIMNRLQDGAVIVLVIFELMIQLTQQKIKNVQLLSKLLLYLSGTCIGVLPLIYHWLHTFNSLLNQTYLRNFVTEQHQLGWQYLFGSLLDPVTGLLVRTPILLVVSCYFVYSKLMGERKINQYLVYPLLFFLIQAVIITAQGGWAAAAYGGRMYISSLPFFALLTVDFLIFLKRKKQYLPLTFVIGLIGLNLLLVAQFVLFQKGGENGNKGTEQRTITRLNQIFE